MKKRTFLLQILTVFVGMAISVFTHAKIIELEVLDSGWYSPVQAHDPDNTNYFAGTSGCSFDTCEHYRNFFVFDASEINDYVTSAKFQLYTGAVTAAGVFSLYDVSTPVTTLVAGGISSAIFSDLGSGGFLGSVTLDRSDRFSIVEFALPQNIYSLLANSNGLFAIGGRYSRTGFQEFAFGGSQTATENKLIVTVPTPGSLALVLLGLLAAFLRVRGLREMPGAEV